MSQPFTKSFTVDQIARACGARLAPTPGLGDTVIRGVATLLDAGPTDVAWIVDIKHAKILPGSSAGAIVGPQKQRGSHPRALLVEDTELAMALVLEMFYTPYQAPGQGRHPTAIVHPSAQLHETVAVGAHATIGEGVQIGAGSVIHEGVRLGAFVQIGKNCAVYDNCVIYDRCEIRNNVVLHAGVVIGADGFGYIFRDGKHRKLLHLGGVIIEDEVEVVRLIAWSSSLIMLNWVRCAWWRARSAWRVA